MSVWCTQVVTKNYTPTAVTGNLIVHNVCFRNALELTVLLLSAAHLASAMYQVDVMTARQRHVFLL
jgi:hypothetical protein